MNKGFFAFGTMNFIRIENMQYDDAIILIDKAIKKCNEMDDRFSVFKNQSDISRINQNAGKRAVKVDSSTIDIVEKSLYYSGLTEGAFNITIRPAMALWDFVNETDKIPDQKEINKVKKLIDYKSVVINRNKNTIFLKHRKQEIDLGGIVKGYAVDYIREMLIENGVTSALLNFGGTIMTIGNNPNDAPWKVGIQNPMLERGESIGIVNISDDALVTSGVNERFFIKEDIRYHHILDSNTLMPSNTGIMSVTVAGKKGIDLDALATALFLCGIENGFDLAKKVGVEALFLTNDGKIYSTQGFAEGKYKIDIKTSA